MSLIPEEPKKAEGTILNSPHRVEENKNDIDDFLFQLDSMRPKNEQSKVRPAEDSKVEQSSSSSRKVETKDLLDLHSSKEQASSMNESVLESSSRNSRLTRVNLDLGTKEGWLLKLAHKSPKSVGWQRRYCVVKNHKFLYYKSDSK